MQIEIDIYSDDTVEQLMELIKSHEKLEVTIKSVLPISIFQIVACNLDKFDLVIENEIMKKAFSNIERIE